MPIALAGDIRSISLFYMTSLKLQHCVSISSKVLAHIRWKPPNKDTVVINVDDVSKSNVKAGCGGLSSDNGGIWIEDFSKNIGVCNSLTSKLWGVFEGFQFAIDKWI